MKALGGKVAFAAGVAAGGFMALTAAFVLRGCGGEPAASAKDVSEAVLRARCFEVVDADGRGVATLKWSREGGACLTFVGAGDRAGVGLGQMPDGDVHLEMVDRRQVRIGIGVYGGRPCMTMNDGNGRPRLELVTDDGGRVYALQAKDATGAPRAIVGVRDDGEGVMDTTDARGRAIRHAP